MLRTVWAVGREGKLELEEPGSLPEGGKALVTLLPDGEERASWSSISH